MNAGKISNTGTFINQGTVSIDENCLFNTENDYIQSTGQTLLNNATFTSDGMVDIQGGILSGKGVINADVTNAGLLNPGESTGVLNITGSYLQTTSGKLNIDISGLSAGVDFDQVNVNCDGTINGALYAQYL
ncbi:hypothetical protein JW960_03550 [candidate division KSB1 bacterium]|nr:hypothetical protein [candidate division KSB1 bacterium]